MVVIAGSAVAGADRTHDVVGRLDVGGRLAAGDSRGRRYAERVMSDDTEGFEFLPNVVAARPLRVLDQLKGFLGFATCFVKSTGLA